MDATSPLARGNPLPAEEAAALTPALPGGNLPWKPIAPDGRGSPAGPKADPTAAHPATEAEAAANPPGLVAAFKQALAGPAATPAPRFPSGPAGEANVTSADLSASPGTASAPPPRPESLYSQMAAAFTAQVSTNASAPAAVPVKTGSVPAPEGTPNNPFAAPAASGPASPAAAAAAAFAPTAPAPSDANLAAPARTARSAPVPSSASGSVEPPAAGEAGSPTLPAHGPTPAPAATPLTTVVSPRLKRVSPGTELGEASAQPAATALQSRTTQDHPRVIAAPTAPPAATPAAITKAPAATAQRQTEKQGSTATQPVIGAAISTQAPAATATTPAALAPASEPSPTSFPPAPAPSTSGALPQASAQGNGPEFPSTAETQPASTAAARTAQGTRNPLPASAATGTPLADRAPALAAPATLSQRGDLPSSTFPAAPASAPFTADQPRPRDTDTGTRPSLDRDAPPAFTAPLRAGTAVETPLPPVAATIPPQAPSAAPASLPPTSTATPRLGPPETRAQPSLTRDAAPAFTAQPRADEGSRAPLPRPAAAASPLPASPAAPTAPATVASRGDVLRPALAGALTSIAATTAGQPRPSATDSAPQPSLTADAQPDFSGQPHSGQGFRTPVPAAAAKGISATAPAGAPIAPASTSARGEVAHPAAPVVTTTPVTASPSGEVPNPPSVAPARPSATDPGQPSSPRDNASPAFTGQPEADEGGRASLPRSAPAAAPTVFAGPAPRGEAPLVALPVAPAPVIAIPATGSRPRAGDSESSGPRAEDAPPAFTAPARDEDGSPPASRTPAGQAPHAPVSATTPQPPASVAPSAEAPLAPGEPVPVWSTPAAQPRRNASETGVQTSPQGDALPVDPLPSSADPVLRPSPATAVATVLQSPVGLPHPAEASAPAKPAAPFASGNPPSSGLPVASASAPARPTAEPRPRATVSDPQSAPRGTTESASIPPTRADRGDEAARPKSVGATPATADTSAPSREVPVAAFPAASASVTARVSAQPRPEASKSEQPPTANGDARAAFTGQPRPDQSKRDPLPSLAPVASTTPVSAAAPQAPAAVAQRVADTLPVFGAAPTQAPVPTPVPIQQRPSTTRPETQAAPDNDPPPAFSGQPRSEPGEQRPIPAAVPTPIASQDSFAAPNTPAASAPRGDVPVSALPVATGAGPARDAAVAHSGVSASAPQPTRSGEARTDDARSDFTGQPRAGQSNLGPLPSPATVGSQPLVSAVAPQVPAIVARSSDTPLPGVPAAQAPAPETTASEQRPSATQANPPAARTDNAPATFSGQPRSEKDDPMPFAASGPTPSWLPASGATPNAPAAAALRDDVSRPTFPNAPASLPAAKLQPEGHPGQAPGTPAPALPAATVSAAPMGSAFVALSPETGDLPASAPAFSVGPLAATPARAEQNDTPPGAPTAESPGDAVLRSLSLQALGLPVPPPVATVPSVAPVSPAERVAALQAAIAETVSRVLVSDPLHDGRREVRIEFAADVLPDTSVRLWRHEGRLQIEFISTGAVADAGLRDGLPRLVESLQRQNPQAGLTEISLRLSDSSGQPGDGRSRQRYQAEEENGAQA